jgi:hypothetical protein
MVSVAQKNIAKSFLLKVVFSKGTTPIQDDNGKTVGDIEKRFSAFNFQLKKRNGEFLSFFLDNRLSFI